MAENTGRETQARSIEEMQALLRLMPGSAYDGNVDGRMDPATREAITSFRQGQGLAADAPDQAILSAMRKTVAAGADTISMMIGMKQFATEDDVKTIQYGLRALGTPLQVTGQMNQPTLNAFDRALAAASPAPSAAKQSLQHDSKVAEIQAGLRLLSPGAGEGYALSRVDGLMGAKTNAALSLFKRDHQLDETASLDDVLQKIQEKIKASPDQVRQNMSAIMAQQVYMQDGGAADKSEIKALQYGLNLAGNALVMDGVAGPKTGAAFAQFQSSSSPAPASPTSAFLAAAAPAPAGVVEIEIPPPEAGQPIISVTAGEETAGMEAPPGVIPMVVVDDPVISEPAPTAPTESLGSGLQVPAFAPPVVAELGVTAEPASAAPVEERSIAAAAPVPAAAPSRFVGSRERELSRPESGTFARAATPRQRPEPGPIQQANTAVQGVTRTINQTVGTWKGFLGAIAQARR